MYHALLSVATLTLAVAVDAAAVKYTNTTTWWKPTAGSTWNIDLSTNPTNFSSSSSVLIYDLDLFGTTAATISSLHAAGHKVICYYSAGSCESWRPDAASFPVKALGKPLAGWAGEKWVNTNDATVRSIMAARIKLAHTKGCDAVDPDNIDGYENGSGFALTTATAIDYVRYLAAQAHALGMASGLKNGGAIAAKVVADVDFEVNEQCVEYQECDVLAPFVKAAKPVFHVEYTEAATPAAKFVAAACGKATKGFSNVIKHLDLGTWTSTCPNGTVVAF